MVQKHRISTKIGKDQKVIVELKQDYDLLEILSLKFTQSEVYSSMCSDYGVVVGRISANNGFGIPNAKVSIFVPLNDEDAQDPVISELYPYKTVNDKNEEGYRYNLLPSRRQHGGHNPTGTFPDQSDVLHREEYLEVYEKYFKYTVKTNESGDFMIWGVPIGTQTLHVDLDLSDMGCFSLRPEDLRRSGIGGVDSYKNAYTFKSSTDIDSLPQIVSFDQTIDVYPFWGNEDLCEIGLTRSDFDLSSRGITIEPSSYLLGSIFSDTDKNSIAYNGKPKKEMGTKCGLIAGPAIIEVLRYTPQKDVNLRPVIESFEVEGDIDEDGSFVLFLPMNMDYVVTNEFGENEITKDTSAGVPTSACYRFRVSMINQSLAKKRGTASYLIPNLREYDNDVEKSYAWSTDWRDYPSSAVSTSVMLNSIDGSYYPKDYFYRFNYNKVYSISSFMGGLYHNSRKDTFLGIKEISPKEEEDCSSSVVTPPMNFGFQKTSFALFLARVVSLLEYGLYLTLISIIQVLIIPFQLLFNFRIYIRAFGVTLIDWRPFQFFDTMVIEPLQRFGTVRLGLITYPDCELCSVEDDIPDTPNTIEPDPATLYGRVGYGVALKDRVFETQVGFSDLDIDMNELVLSDDGTDPNIQYQLDNTYGQTLSDILAAQSNATNSRYIIKIVSYVGGNPVGATVPAQTNLVLDTYLIGTTSSFKHIETSNIIPFNAGWTYLNYEIYDTDIELTQTSGQISSTNESNLSEGCGIYNTLYDETLVRRSYCVTDPSIDYTGLTTNDLVLGSSCSTGTIVVGQTIHETDDNPCATCVTHSGFSEFRKGIYTIIPAASLNNWSVNRRAIREFFVRKSIAKQFCEGVINYSFVDNWLTGSLFMFPFKNKVRWDDEEILDLNYRRTKYPEEVVYFKVKEGFTENGDKRFYYRSTPFNGSSFYKRTSTNRLKQNIGHPTTIMDLGPRDEFIKEICTDPQLDPNCSVVRNIGSTSYKPFGDIVGLYINYRLDVASSYESGTDLFFENTGFSTYLPNSMDNKILNGDLLQLLSINNEAGINGFDLDDKNYTGYNPQVLDVESYETLFRDNNDPTQWGPLPINFVLEENEGYRLRVCLNEPGRLTESSQDVPFFLWDKKGTGFGSGVSQSWDYSTVETQPLQGMTKNYSFNYDSTYKYVLFPMTKPYSGDAITIDGVDLNDVTFNIESTVDTHTDYNNQEEGFTFLHVTAWSSGQTESEKIENATDGTLYVKVGSSAGSWATLTWRDDTDFIIKPTQTNYSGNKQILSTPFLFYFGLKPGNTAVDKFIKYFGPLGAFPNQE